MTKLESSTHEEELATSDDVANLVWDKLLEWLNNQDTLDPSVKHYFVERAEDLRTKMQAIYLEMQRKNLTAITEDVHFEGEMRRMLKQNYPYMTANQQMNALKVFADANEKKLKRLEAQLYGFDIFETVQKSVESVSEIKVKKELYNTVKQMSSDKRQKMLNVLTSVVAELQSNEPSLLGEAANDRTE